MMRNFLQFGEAIATSYPPASIVEARLGTLRIVDGITTVLLLYSIGIF